MEIANFPINKRPIIINGIIATKMKTMLPPAIIAIIAEKIIINGALITIRIHIWNDIWTLLTSVVILVIKLEDENLSMLANQNVALKMFEIRGKYFNDQNITQKCDEISKEIQKLPGQEQNTEAILREAIADFNMNSNLDNLSKKIKCEKILDGHKNTIINLIH